jgi:hypothetical protein
MPSPLDLTLGIDYGSIEPLSKGLGEWRLSAFVSDLPPQALP